MWRKLLFFAWLYFVQGAALAYVINFQKPYLLAKGVPLPSLGLFTSLLLIPFILKVGLGYLSDRFPLGAYGSRKPYMLGALLVFALCFFALAFLDPAQGFFKFASVMWLASLALAWFDTCADGWAVDSSEEHEQSAVQAAMVVGKSLGLVLMSLLFGVLANQLGFGVIFTIIGALSLLVLIVVALTRYRPRAAPAEVVVLGWRSLVKDYYLAFAGFAVVYAAASFGTDGLLTVHLKQVHGADPMDIGLFGMWRGLGALSGAIAYALVRPALGIKRAQYFGLFILSAGCLIPLLGGPPALSAGSWGICWGFQETAFVTLAMRFSEGRWAATLFAGAMIFSNIGNSIGEALAGPLVSSLGYNGVFLMFSVMSLFALAFLPKVFKPIHLD